jgi:hypothetical protein
MLGSRTYPLPERERRTEGIGSNRNLAATYMLVECVNLTLPESKCALPGFARIGCRRLASNTNGAEKQEKLDMKHSKTVVAGAIFLLATAITSLAMAQGMGPKMDRFLGDHPELAAQVRANPSLLYDRQFRHDHPELQTFMQNHPNEYKTLEDHGVGAFDSGHVWHDAGWWHQNNPGWVTAHHPEWAANHPDWKADAAGHPYGDAVGHPYGTVQQHEYAEHRAEAAEAHAQYKQHHQ